MSRWDAIVVGVGGAGSAALFHLARRGARVLGLDRFLPGHDQGSSHGQTRIIRLAYFEEPRYVPLIRRAYTLWEELEHLSGQTLYRETGLLQVGPTDGAVLQGVDAAATAAGLEIERLTPREVALRFPAFHVDEGLSAVYERRAGLLAVEACVQAHVRAAEQHGARLSIGERVERWRVDGAGVIVETDRATYAADRLVLTPGAFAGPLLSGARAAVTPVRKSLFWYGTSEPRFAADQGAPAFLFETAAGIFYGMPAVDADGVKLGEHSGGVPLADPWAVDRTIGADEAARVEDFAARHLPGLGRRRTRSATCLYELSFDEHFFVDVHPSHREVVFAAGLSGHGFKMTPVLGEILAELALDGATRHPTSFLRVDPAARPRAVARG